MCATALEEATNSIIILVILGVGLLGVAVALCVQAGKAKAAHLEEVRYTHVSCDTLLSLSLSLPSPSLSLGPLYPSFLTTSTSP